MDMRLNSNIIEDIFIIDSANLYETQIIQQCFDIVGVFVAGVDLDGNITLVNKKGRKILGHEESYIVGKNFIDSFIEDNKKKETSEFFQLMMQEQSNYPEKTRYHLQTENNKTKIIEAKNITVRDTNNTILGILISGEDVTDFVKSQYNLQKDINLYRILANSIPDINLYLFDKDFRFILAEGSEMKNNGFTREYFEGKTLSEIKNKKILEIWKPYFSAALEGKKVSTEYSYNNYYYLMWIVPIMKEDNDAYSGVAITQNITDDRITEQKLKKSKQESEHANRAKSDFLARVSHEIRTPLNAILGFTEQLKQTSLTQQQSGYVNIIDKSSEHLLSLINDILVISKVEARQINFDMTPFKVEYTVKYVYDALRVKAQEKGLRFSYDIDAKLDGVLIGDAFRLRQILINLINNAIKFTSSGYVELRCFLTEETKDEMKIRFDVIDTGIGIKPENLETVFEQFKQADSNITKKYGGTGLGLTICKNLIEMQHGSLSVSSQEGIGSTFSFIIPYKKGEKSDLIPDNFGSVDTQKLSKKKVLLVDDDSVNRLLGKTILEKFNCKFDIANNGKDAISKLNKAKYDIVLLDIHMPDIDGTEVAKYLRNEKRDKKTKIVAVTAAVMKDDIKKYYKAGIDDFIIKPFKEIHLFNKMCEILKIKGQPNNKPVEEIILKEEISPKSYNLMELKMMTGNNPAVLNKMITAFIENSENAIELFDKYKKEKNLKPIGELAHKILPSYRHLEVKNIVADLEQIKLKTIVSPDIELVTEVIERIVIKMKKLIFELQNELNQS